jgi:hypothetical protein
MGAWGEICAFKGIEDSRKWPALREATKGKPWTPESITRAHHALPLRSATPETALWPFQGLPAAGWAAYGHLLPLGYPTPDTESQRSSL